MQELTDRPRGQRVQNTAGKGHPDFRGRLDKRQFKHRLLGDRDFGSKSRRPLRLLREEVQPQDVVNALSPAHLAL